MESLLPVHRMEIQLHNGKTRLPQQVQPLLHVYRIVSNLQNSRFMIVVVAVLDGREGAVVLPIPGLSRDSLRNYAITQLVSRKT